MEASLRAKELLLTHYEKVSGVPMCVISKMVQFFNTDSHYKTAKECALVSVEIAVTDLSFVIPKEAFDYWVNVKAEIEKL